MASVIFLKDHKGHKKGPSPVAIPALEAIDLVRDKIAIYFNRDLPKPPAAKVEPDLVARLEQQARDHAEEIRLHTGEIARLAAALETANKRIAELTKKP